MKNTMEERLAAADEVHAIFDSFSGGCNLEHEAVPDYCLECRIIELETEVARLKELIWLEGWGNRQHRMLEKWTKALS